MADHRAAQMEQMAIVACHSHRLSWAQQRACLCSQGSIGEDEAHEEETGQTDETANFRSPVALLAL